MKCAEWLICVGYYDKCSGVRRINNDIKSIINSYLLANTSLGAPNNVSGTVLGNGQSLSSSCSQSHLKRQKQASNYNLVWLVLPKLRNRGGVSNAGSRCWKCCIREMTIDDVEEGDSIWGRRNNLNKVRKAKENMEHSRTDSCLMGEKKVASSKSWKMMLQQ